MDNAPQASAYYGTRDHTSVLALKGQVRYLLARSLRTFVDDVVAHDGSDTVIIDLCDLEFIDSTGMGLLARIGRVTLAERGRRAIIVCPREDVRTVLCSAAFDVLFEMLREYPFDPGIPLRLVPLAAPEEHLGLVHGQVILEAHYDLAALSEKNRQAFGDAIAVLEADLKRKAAAH